jgi:hypothetical protein
MTGAIDDNERTSELGLFNTARSYWHSAEHLNAANLKVTHPQAPVTFLFCHAIELYLKAFLRGAGKSVAELKQIGHRVANLAKAAVSAGFKIEPEQSEVLSHIDDASVAIEARYIVTGFKNLPTNEALSGAAAYLDQTVFTALSNKGIPVRSEIFERPAPREASPIELEPETIAILLHLFRAESEQDRDAKNMALIFNLEQSVVQYELDNLREAGLAEPTDVNSIWDTVSWGLTSEGRRYVIQRKLHKLDAT